MAMTQFYLLSVLQCRYTCAATNAGFVNEKNEYDIDEIRSALNKDYITIDPETKEKIVTALANCSKGSKMTFAPNSFP